LLGLLPCIRICYSNNKIEDKTLSNLGLDTAAQAMKVMCMKTCALGIRYDQIRTPTNSPKK
jgi:hypothetical protein